MNKRLFLIITIIFSFLVFFTSCPDYVGDIADEFRNNAPEPRAGSDRYVLAGSLVSLDGSGSTDPENDQLDFLWKFASIPLGESGGSVSSLTDDDIVGRTMMRAVFTPDVPGIYDVALRVSDGQDTAEDIVRIIALDPGTDNELPVAEAGDGQSVKEGDSITISGTGSTDPDGYSDIVSFDWDLGDGSTSSGETVMHTYSTAGEYTVELTVTDSQGATDTDTLTVTVTAAAVDGPPSAFLTYTLNSGTLYDFDGSASYDPDGDAMTYEWKYTLDGVYFSYLEGVSTFSSITLKLKADFIYTVYLTVFANGLSDTASVKISTISSISTAELNPSADIAYWEADYSVVDKAVNFLGWYQDSRDIASRYVTLMKFDLTALEGKKIVKAILSYQATGFETSDSSITQDNLPKQQIVSLLAETDWTEEKLGSEEVYDPSDPYGVADSLIMLSLGKYELDLTGMVSLWTSGEIANRGVALVSAKETAPVIYLTGSSENEKAMPVLSIEYSD